MTQEPHPPPGKEASGHLQAAISASKNKCWFPICNLFSMNSIYIQVTCSKRAVLYFQQFKEHLEAGMKKTLAMFHKFRRETQGHLGERACTWVCAGQDQHLTQQVRSQHESPPSPFSFHTKAMVRVIWMILSFLEHSHRAWHIQVSFQPDNPTHWPWRIATEDFWPNPVVLHPKTNCGSESYFWDIILFWIFYLNSI